MVCEKLVEEFFRIYNRLPEAEKNKPIIQYQGRSYTWKDLANLFRTAPELACYLWTQYKSIVVSAPSVSVY